MKDKSYRIVVKPIMWYESKLLFGRKFFFFKVMGGFPWFKNLDIVFGRVEGFLKYDFLRFLKTSKDFHFTTYQIACNEPAWGPLPALGTESA